MSQVAKVGPPSPKDRFNQLVNAAIAQIETRCPTVFAGIQIISFDVPEVDSKTDVVLLAEAIAAHHIHPAKIVLYRRPLEHRAANPAELGELVHRVLVEQTAILTGFTIADLAGNNFDI